MSTLGDLPQLLTESTRSGIGELRDLLCKSLAGAGTKVPMHREIEISNAEDNQESLTLRIVQGASTRPEANSKVGTYVNGGITPAPKGSVSITLRLELSDTH